jgi:hypothetical protein
MQSATFSNGYIFLLIILHFIPIGRHVCVLPALSLSLLHTLPFPLFATKSTCKERRGTTYSILRETAHIQYSFTGNDKIASPPRRITINSDRLLGQAAKV